MRSRVPWRAIAAAFGVAALTMGTLATGAQASSTFTVTFKASPGSCVAGTSNRIITRLGIWDASGEIDHVDNVAPDIHDKFLGCFPTATVRPGRTLHAFDGTDVMQFQIPPLSLSIGRVTDIVKGVSRAHHALTIRANDCTLITSMKACPHKVTRTVTTDGGGHYRKDLTSAFDLRGSDSVGVTFTGVHGDTYTVTLHTPFMEVNAGATSITAHVNPGQHVAFHLKSSPGGSTIESHSLTGPALGYGYSLPFTHTLRPPRQLTSDFASDARVTVPASILTVTIEHHDQIIRATCLPDRKMVISWPGAIGGATRTGDSHGRAHVNLSSAEHNGFRLASNAELYTACETASGDRVVYGILAP